MKATQLRKANCKNLLFNMLYGGRTETWLKEHELTEDVIPQQFVDMRDELQEATATLLDRYPMYREAAVNTKGADYWKH
jgi:enoyl reductase-like protein